MNLFRPVDSRSLGVFRVLFGLIVVYSGARTLAKGWVAAHHIEPVVHFPWPGFEWVRRLPGDGPYFVVVALILAGLGLAIGWRARLMAGCVAVLVTYELLLDQTLYLNHIYLTALIAGVLAMVPARCAPTVGAAEPAPAWCLWTLRGLLLVVYVYAGLSKLQPDWLALAPLTLTLSPYAEVPVLGPVLTARPVVAAAAYGVIAIEVLAPLLLLWRRTLPFGLAALGAFHLGTAVLYDIGIFPWLCLACLTLFLPPDWPRFVKAPGASHRWRPSRVVAGLVAVFAVVQLLLPLRPYFLDGDPSWTRQGHQFSWRLLLAHKSGWVRLELRDGERTQTLSPYEVLTPWQAHRVAQDPDLIRQFARWVAAESGRPVQVYAQAQASLNGRPFQRLVRPDVDLVHATDWIVPLTTPLPETPARPDGDLIAAQMWGADALVQDGLRSLKAREFKAAVRAFRGALRVEPDHVRAQLNLGVALRADGDLAGAADVFESLVASHPERPEGWLELVATQRGMGQMDKARENARRGLARHPQLTVLRQVLEP